MDSPTQQNMTIEIDIDKKRNLFRQWGQMNKATIIQSYHFILGTDGFDPSFDTLIDYREIEEVNIGPQDFKEIFSETKDLEIRTGRGAMIIGDNTGRLMLAKLYCEFSKAFSSAKIEFKSFRSMENAEEWLDSKK